MNIFGRFQRKASQAGTAIAQFVVGQPVWTARNLANFAEEGYRKNVIAYRSITTIAQAAASVPWMLYSGKKSLEKHEILDLLNRPNPIQGGAELIESLVSSRLITGNSYLEAVRGLSQKGPAKELWVLRPDRMRVVPAANGMVQRYEYEVNGQTVAYPCDFVTGQGNVLHLKTYHPLDDWYGMSPLEAAAYSVDQHNSAGAWNQALLQNGARPGGAFLYKGELTEAEKARLRQAVDDRHVGAKNAGKPLLLFGEATYQEMGISPKDMDFVNAKHTSARDIALAFGVPPQLLGIPGDNTYSNMAEARLALWEETILPLMEHITDALNNWLIPMYGSNLRLGFDTDAIPALVMRRQEKQKSVTELYDRGLISQEEGRDELGYGEKDANHTFKAPAVPSFSFGGSDGSKSAPKRIERKDWVPTGVIEVGSEVDDPSVRAKTSVLIEDMLAKLVDNLGADVVEEIGNRTSLEKNHRVQNFIKDRAGELISKVNKTTRKQIRAQLAEGFDQGETVEQLQERVASVFKQAGEQRAYTIAQTESTGAAGFAANEAIKQAGLTQKSWLSTQDEATRESHQQMDGQTVEVDGMFISPAGGQAPHPGGFGIAEEDIGCRCVEIAAFGKAGKSMGPEERKALWQKRETKRAAAERIIVPVMHKVFEIQRASVNARILQMIDRIEISGPQISN